MPEEKLPPPIASPHGSGQRHQQTQKTDTETIVIPVSVATSFRSFCADCLHPANILIIFVVMVVLAVLPNPIRNFYRPLSLAQLFFIGIGLHFLVASMLPISTLLFGLHTEIEVRPVGIYIRNPRWNILWSWRKIKRILHFNNDIWLITLTSIYLIPCDSFDSPAHSKKFTQAIRQLWQTRGAS
ncbi:hypothetical protein EON83_26790 [bacterium]|nr:MAG: hypothetical protein EON83_26790 [bacterium]